MQICQYNDGCECEERKCDKCGWNPAVAERRMKEVRAGAFAKKYKIPFRGYCEIWANSAEEAAEKVDHDTMYYAEYIFGKPVCLAPEEDEDELD